MRAASTQDLTKAFGWENNEAMQQHDVHELNRILFDALEQSLSGTEHAQVISDMFFGQMSNVITCTECNSDRNVCDRFLDIGLQVKGLKGVNESLEELFKFESFTGDNRLTCEKCDGKKTDSKKGIRISKLAPVLTFSLNRFELDYETW